MRSIIATSEIVSCLFMIVIFVAILQQNLLYRSNRTRSYIYFVLSEIVGLLADAICYITRGPQYSVLYLTVINTLPFILTNFCIVSFSYYVVTSVREKMDFSYKRIYVILAIAAVDIIWIIAGACTGNLFYIANGEVFYGSWHDYVSVLPILNIMYMFITAFSGIRQLGMRNAIVLSTYLFLPTIVSIYLLLDPRYDFSYVSSSLSCIIIYIFIQTDTVTDANISLQVMRAANNAKTEFLANMSHDIRTPINTIMGMDEMILRECDDQKIKGYAADIQSAGNTLLSIVSDILDISGIESGKMEIVVCEYDISSLLYDVWNMINSLIGEKMISFEVSVSESIPMKLLGDDIRIRQILMNLLVNAVKYTNDGTIWFRVGIVSSEEDFAKGEVTLQFEIEDTGIGIKQEDMERILLNFERLDRDKNKGIEGAGLGIPITHNLLSLMDSKLNISSKYGKGSVFSFDLKQKVVDKNPIGDFNDIIERHAIDEDAYKTSLYAPEAKVLVVDDNDMNRKVIVSLLGKTQIKLYEAESGEKSVAMASKQHFDLIFMDHMMPGMDGIEAMKLIKTQKDGPNIDTPIIVLTANAIVGAKDKYLEDGFDGFVSKPVSAADLEKTLADYLPEGSFKFVKSVDKDDDQCDNHDISVNMPDVFGVDWKYALVRLQSQKILDSLLREFDITIDQQADSLQRYKDGLPDTISDYCTFVHGMKSASGSLGMITLSGMAAILEKAAGENDIDTIDRLHDVFIREWRSYKEVFREFLFTDDASSDQKEEVDSTVIYALLDIISSAMKEMDIDGADDAIRKMSEYILPEEVDAEFDNLKTSVASLNQDMVAEVINRIRKQVGR